MGILWGFKVSNIDTGYIKIFKVLRRASLLTFVLSSLLACQPHASQIYNDTHSDSDSIMGGEPVQASSSFSKRVIYLALGVTWTMNGKTKQVKQKELCTASAISPTILLTAAHCVKGLEPAQVYAILSTNPWNHSIIESEWVKVEKILIHEKYEDLTGKNGILHNDIALIKLSAAIPKERVSKLVKAPQVSDNFSIVSIGYGLKSAFEQVAAPEKLEDAGSTLLYYLMKNVENYNPRAALFSINQNDRTGICSGDSGGPGFIYDSEEEDFFIVGVTSFFSINDEEEKRLDPNNIYNKCIGHGHYTNVLYHLDWIQNSMLGL